MVGTVGIIALTGITIAVYKTRKDEYKRYNGGTCLICNDKMEAFDMDSQGGTGWICRNCGASFWTSWVNHKKLFKGMIK